MTVIESSIATVFFDVPSICSNVTMCLIGKDFRLGSLFLADWIGWLFVGCLKIAPAGRANGEFPTRAGKRMLFGALSRYVGAASLPPRGSRLRAPSSWSWRHGRFTSRISC